MQLDYIIDFNPLPTSDLTAPASCFSSSAALPSQKVLRSLREKMRECLSSTCQPLFYVAPVACGGGKSRTVQSFIRDWKASGFATGGSIIVMLATLEEVDTYISSCGLDVSDYACLSPNEQYARYGLGRSKAGEAKVLFVTHEQVRRRTVSAGSFEAVVDFHFDGRPRPLRLWDEAFTPAVPIALRLSTLEALVDVVAPRNEKLAEQIDGLRLNNNDRKPGTIVRVSIELRDEALRLAFAGREWMSRDHSKALEDLGHLAGRPAVLRRDNRSKTAGGLFLVGWSAPLPNDLAPCIIMDASANLRESYSLWANRTGLVEFLDSESVTYRGLQLHWWPVGANKSALSNRKEREKVLGVVAATVNSQPDTQWLIVHPKEVPGCSIRDEIVAGLKQPNADFLHWGRHLGRNEHREIKNVIIIGSLHYGQIGYEALYAASVDNLGEADAAAIKALSDGEFAHHVYQAACRSNLRNIVNGVAGDATVYLITPQNRERRTRLKHAFPGCDILSWQPVTPKPKGKERQFMSAVTRLFEDGRRSVTLKEIWHACGARDAKFLYPLWKREPIKAFLTDKALERRGNKLLRRHDQSRNT